ncbi:Caltractin-like protein [Argiope bruennichi]|uniref:Caltractin-like protein n=1 Tax=Argiope bruennichi TaxID=94029 RepID=A0A8T0E8P0_ARGBR|nr:Caltractin-like protein [Argiope bruennichi]
MASDIQDAFSILDREGKGTISERDIKLDLITLRALGMEATPKKIKKLIGKITSKNADEISREDYEKMMLHVINDIDSDEHMEQSFKIFNTDGSGTISIGQLKRIANTLELDLTNEEMQEMIYVADADRDGIVTKEEFIDIARKIF